MEHSTKTWFGPRRRARELLSAGSRPSPLSAAAFLGAISELLGEQAASITGVRFIDFVYRDEEFHFTIALCWTRSDPLTRDLLFERAADIVSATGWYPLAAGERLSSTRWARGRLVESEEVELEGLTSLVSVESAGSGAEAGTAIRVRFDVGSVLLDVGFGPGFISDPDDAAVLLSHAHRDHAGGVLEGVVHGLPVVMSRATCSLLGSRMDGIENVMLVEPGDEFPLGNIRVRVLSIPHSPGSVGYVLDDGDRALLYTGDVVLRSARHSAQEELIDALPKDRQCTVLLDATMAGRDVGASNHEVAASVLSIQASDIVLTGAADQLAYALADLFHVGKEVPFRGTVSYLVSASVRNVVRTIHDAFIRRDFGSLDPLLHAQYGPSMSAWAESVWLYWLDGTRALPAGRRIWLVDPNATDSGPSPPADARVLAIGRGSNVAEQGVDTTPWTAHSNASTLVHFIRQLEERGVQVVLFHNFTSRLKKFSRSNGLAARALQGPIDL